jgi:TolB-like protein
LVWPGLVVEDNNLQVQISTLRKILGYEAIATIPGIGYRFLLALEPTVADAGPSDSGKEPSPAPGGDTTPESPAEATQTELSAIPRHSAPFPYRSVLITAALIVVIGAVAWLLLAIWTPARQAQMSPPPMSITVLPFRPNSADEGEVRLADALTRDVQTELAKWNFAKVVPYDRFAASTRPATDAREIGNVLGVRYLAEGGIRREGDKYVLTARLLDTNSAVRAWSERLEFPAQQWETMRPAPRDTVAEQLSDWLWMVELRRAVEQRASGSAVELTLRAWDALRDREVGSIRAARKLLREALELDPRFVPAAFAGVIASVWEGWEDPTTDLDGLAQDADRWSSLAIRADAKDEDAWRARALALTLRGRWDEAFAANDRAGVIAPESIEVLLQRAHLYQFSGRPAEALAAVEQALPKIDPKWTNTNGNAYHYLCKARLYLGQYDLALSSCERAAVLMNHWWIQFYLVAAYTHTGETAKAAIAKTELLRRQPGFSIARYRAMLRSSPPKFFELHEKHVAVAARKAGIPDQ